MQKKVKYAIFDVIKTQGLDKVWEYKEEMYNTGKTENGHILFVKKRFKTLGRIALELNHYKKSDLVHL